MRKIELADVLDLETYEELRPRLRAESILEKQLRRVEVGPHLTALFENRRTAMHQLHEVVRVEALTQIDALLEQVALANDLIPAEGELILTIFVERELGLGSIEDHLSLRIGGRTLSADADTPWRAENVNSGVAFVSFSLDGELEPFLTADDVRLRIDHPHYTHEARLPEATLEALRADVTLEESFA